MEIPYWLRSDKNKENRGNKENNEEVKIPDSLISKLNKSCIGIADKTIILQFRQFKTPRKKMNELALEKIKTYRLSEAETEKYLYALEKINEGNNIEIENNINVDLGGFSYEIAGKLGIDYLKDNFILASIKQRDCGIIKKIPSFVGQLIKETIDINYKKIEQILLGEALIGKIYTQATRDKPLEKILDNPEGIFNIEFKYDTPNNAISKLKIIRENEGTLLKDINKLKDRIFLKQLLDNIENINNRHGSIDRIIDIIQEEIILKKNLSYYKLTIESLDIYCLKAKQVPVFIYFDPDNILKDAYIRKDSIILNGKDVDSIDILIGLGLVGYSPLIGLERAANMIMRNREENIRKIIEKNTESKKLFLAQLTCDDRIPKKAEELLLEIEKLIDKGLDRDFFLNLKTKSFMTYPLIQNDILYELLFRMENDEIKSDYTDTKKFIQMSSKMDDGEFTEFMKKILQSLEFEEEYNPTVNTWLKENKEETCKKLDIRFY